MWSESELIPPLSSESDAAVFRIVSLKNEEIRNARLIITDEMYTSQLLFGVGV